MSESAPHPPLDAPLPRGRHTLDPATVRAHQRERLLAAAAGALREEGYWSLKVSDIASRAGVSRATFYVNFSDKLDCLLAAHAGAAEGLVTAIELACAGAPGWPTDVVAAITAAVEFASASPARASLLTFEALATERSFALQVDSNRNRLAALLRAAAQRGGHAAPLTELTERALVGGSCSVIAATLRDDRTSAPDQIGPQLAEFILTPYLGRSAARRHASLSASAGTP